MEKQANDQAKIEPVLIQVAPPQLPEASDGHTVKEKESPPLFAGKGSCGAGFDLCGFDMGSGCC